MSILPAAGFNVPKRNLCAVLSVIVPLSGSFQAQIKAERQEEVGSGLAKAVELLGNATAWPRHLLLFAPLLARSASKAQMLQLTLLNTQQPPPCAMTSIASYPPAPNPTLLFEPWQPPQPARCGEQKEELAPRMQRAPRTRGDEPPAAQSFVVLSAVLPPSIPEIISC